MERKKKIKRCRTRLARMEALLMQHLGLGPTCLRHRGLHHHRYRAFSSRVTTQRGHLTTDITPSRPTHPDDHRPGHWTDPHILLLEDQRHLLDDHDEFMSQLTPLRDHRHVDVILHLQVCAPVAFDIGVAYREGVDKASLFLLVKCFSSRDGKLLKALGMDNILGFDWLASPAPEAMIRTLEVLYARGVLDEDAKLTSPIGFQVSYTSRSQSKDKGPVVNVLTTAPTASNSSSSSDSDKESVADISSSNSSSIKSESHSDSNLPEIYKIFRRRLESECDSDFIDEEFEDEMSATDSLSESEEDELLEAVGAVVKEKLNQNQKQNYYFIDEEFEDEMSATDSLSESEEDELLEAVGAVVKTLTTGPLSFD
ncbi:hypothetical protein Scep_007889 [Stephania cephalantha]|uniref:Uncharacterized protein n=1 Tax=Stephania cephalantha TaxID=152367 RepID=A0AAP0KDD5_9MAGN